MHANAAKAECARDRAALCRSVNRIPFDAHEMARTCQVREEAMLHTVGHQSPDRQVKGLVGITW